MATANLAPTNVRLNKDYNADIDVLLSLVPDKMAFKIGEVSEMLGLKNHVLRYWESEFPGLKPKKSNHNQRMYTIKEIEILLMVRKFLYVDKFSISGARKALRDAQKTSSKNDVKTKKTMSEIATELQHLKTKISSLRQNLIM